MPRAAPSAWCSRAPFPTSRCRRPWRRITGSRCFRARPAEQSQTNGSRIPARRGAGGMDYFACYRGVLEAEQYDLATKTVRGSLSSAAPPDETQEMRIRLRCCRCARGNGPCWSRTRCPAGASAAASAANRPISTRWPNSSRRGMPRLRKRLSKSSRTRGSTMPIPKRCVAVWVSALCLFAAVCQHALAVDLVREGQPVATVVVEEAASAQVKAAAQLLVDYVERATGARLPVVNALPPEGTVICGPGSGLAPPSRPVLTRTVSTSRSRPPDGCRCRPHRLGHGIRSASSRAVRGCGFSGRAWRRRARGAQPVGSGGAGAPGAGGVFTPVQRVAGEARHVGPRNRMRGRVSFTIICSTCFRPRPIPRAIPSSSRSRTASASPPANDTHHWQPCFTAPGIVEEAVTSSPISKPTPTPRRIPSARTTAAATANANRAGRGSPARRISSAASITPTSTTTGPIA